MPQATSSTADPAGKPNASTQWCRHPRSRPNETRLLTSSYRARDGVEHVPDGPGLCDALGRGRRCHVTCSNGRRYSATQEGLAAPSTSNVSFRVSLVPALESSTDSRPAPQRSFESTGTGEGNLTRLSP